MEEDRLGNRAQGSESQSRGWTSQGTELMRVSEQLSTSLSSTCCSACLIGATGGRSPLLPASLATYAARSPLRLRPNPRFAVRSQDRSSARASRTRRRRRPSLREPSRVASPVSSCTRARSFPSRRTRRTPNRGQRCPVSFSWTDILLKSERRPSPPLCPWPLSHLRYFRHSHRTLLYRGRNRHLLPLNFHDPSHLPSARSHE